MISEAALFAIGLVTGGISSAIIVQRLNARAFDEYDDDLVERDAKILNLNAECDRLAGIVAEAGLKISALTAKLRAGGIAKAANARALVREKAAQINSEIASSTDTTTARKGSNEEV